MNMLYLAGWGYTAFVLQSSLAPEIAIGPYVPQILMLALTIAVLKLNEIPGICAAGILGLLSDSLAPIGLGTDVVCFLIAAIAMQQLPRKDVCRSPVLLCLLNFGCLSLLCCLSTWLRSRCGGVPFDCLRCVDLASGSAGYTALLGCGGMIVWESLNGWLFSPGGRGSVTA